MFFCVTVPFICREKFWMQFHIIGGVFMGEQPDVLIIGGGPGGIASLIWSLRLGLNALLLEKEEELGGQLLQVFNPIIDYPGLPVADGRELQQHFVNHLRHWEHCVRCRVEAESLDLAARKVHSRGETYQSRFLILALGARPRRLGVPGEEEMLARGEVYSVARDRERFRGRRVAVVGGGDRALEGALLLAEEGAEVLLIHRSDRFRARQEFLGPVRRHPRIRLFTHAVVREIVGRQRTEGVVVARLPRGEGGREQGAVEDFFPAEAVFVRIGVEPNSHLLSGQLPLDEDGYVVVNETGETGVENVFAVGDLCTRPQFSSISMATAQGMVAAKTIAARLAGIKGG
jgi:thioredoxin reductase (NADPH)